MIEKFGPLAVSKYVYAPNRTDVSNCALPFISIWASFLTWMSNTDLLETRISIDETDRPVVLGWFNFIDPLSGNTVHDRRCSHEAIIRFSRALNDLSKETLKTFR